MERNKCYQRDGSDYSFRGWKRPSIFADLLSSKNDNDDIQIGAKKGKFTAEGKWYTSDGTTQNFPKSHLTHNSDGTWKEDFRTAGVDTYDLYYTVTRKELEDTAGVTDDLFATEQEGSVTQSFMNKYAISPVPPSNVAGSDKARESFTFEWEKDFPTEGEYTVSYTHLTLPTKRIV